MRNSLIRYELINRTLKKKTNITREDLRNLFSTKYPEGLCCHYYDDFFGTLRSMIFDLNEGVVETCFGSPVLNQWRTFRIDGPFERVEYPEQFTREKTPPGFFEMI